VRRPRTKSDKSTHLRPRKIGCDHELHVPVPENAKDHPAEVPLVKTATAFEESERSVLLAGLVLGPCLAAVATRVHLFLVGRINLLDAPARLEAGEDEDGLDPQLLERAEVRLDTSNERERQPAGGSEQRLARGRVLGESVQVVGRVDAEAGVGQRREREGLNQLLVGQVSCAPRLVTLISYALVCTDRPSVRSAWSSEGRRRDGCVQRLGRRYAPYVNTA
jgi:hypothetical protein